jgi:hypothetical protein
MATPAIAIAGRYDHGTRRVYAWVSKGHNGARRACNSHHNQQKPAQELVHCVPPALYDAGAGRAICKTRLSRNSVRIMHATLRAVRNAAIDDGVILTNPALRLGQRAPSARPSDGVSGDVAPERLDPVPELGGARGPSIGSWRLTTGHRTPIGTSLNRTYAGNRDRRYRHHGSRDNRYRCADRGRPVSVGGCAVRGGPPRPSRASLARDIDGSDWHHVDSFCFVAIQHRTFATER